MNNAVISQLVDKIRIVHDEEECNAILRDLGSSSINGPVKVAFVNAHAVNMCFSDPEFLQDLLNCDYVFRDGAGMKILYRLLQKDPGLNMNGTDFIPRILEQYKGQDVALMGTNSPYLEKASGKIADMGLSPAIVMNGFHSNDAYIDNYREKPVPLVVLAMGMPKQERVASLLSERASGNVLIVCGGAILDFIGEKIPRAPEMFRNLGLEWFYRLMQEPQRLFKRYVLGNAVFLYRSLCHVLSRTPSVSGKKRILHVVRQYSPAIGGLESYVQSMAKHQTDLGYECEVLTLNKIFHGDGSVLPERETIEGIPVRRVKFFGRRRFFIPLVSPLYFKDFDIVHVHNTDVFYDYIALVSAITKVPCFATTHGGFFHTGDFAGIKKIYFNTITRFSSFWYKAIFAISQNDFDVFKGLNKNIVLQPNAVEPLGDNVTSGQDFLYIGRLAEHKNVPLIIEAFSHLKKIHGVAGKLHVIGPEWDVSIDDLKAITQKLDIADAVEFHGAADRTGMEKISQKCGYFLSASSFEGFGMSMIEAMSVGIVPFVQNNESFKELIGQAGIGLIVDYTNPETAAKQISDALPGISLETRNIAHLFAQKFSWKKLVADTAQTYEGSAV